MVRVCGILTTVNVGVAVAVTRSRIVLNSQGLSTIGLPASRTFPQDKILRPVVPVVMVGRPGVGRVGRQQSLHTGEPKLPQLSSWLSDISSVG